MKIWVCAHWIGAVGKGIGMCSAIRDALCNRLSSGLVNDEGIMKNKSTGCFVAAIIGILLIGILGVAAFLWMLNVRNASVKEAQTLVRETMHASEFVSRMEEEGRLVLDREEIRKFPMPNEGDKITRERFAAFMIDEDATELSKEAFRKATEGASVSWMLRTAEVFENDGVIKGDFDLPWEISDDNRTTRSSITVRAEFTAESRKDLLNLRRDDWVTVEGTLSFRGNGDVTLKEARLAPRPDE